MSSHQVKDGVKKEKEKGGADSKRKEQKGQHEKRGGKVGAVLKDINENPRREKK
ncbi:hypothetical protein [Halomonas sp. 3H]|jgi:hypothetical protein|uniref:hypothetical protein n=1 Tax=Halomonas TaxID=2745 RepID=UPI0020B793DE|nr:hypothetical protein [Halomonas sp. 3H]